MPEPLLAKSQRPGRPLVTLEQHLLDTEEAAVGLFGLDRRWGRAFTRFFKVADHAHWLIHLRIAALFHDVGKANADFLLMARGGRPDQVVRHEHLSALVLCLPEVRKWLEQSTGLDVDAITAAVLSHHLKATDEPGPAEWCGIRGLREEVAIALDHPEVRRTLDRVAFLGNLEPAPLLPTQPYSRSGVWKESLDAGIRHARALGRALRKSETRSAFLMSLKAGLVAADSAASGLVRQGLPLSDWIGERANGPALTADEVHRDVIQPRVQMLSKKAPFRQQSFQSLAEQQGDRALLLAACGAGKSLAAWYWATSVARRREIGRVIFLYPTRGTATEGYRDYVGWAPETKGELLHGTARFELEAMLENPDEPLADHLAARSEADERLFALAYWSSRYFSATVDQFLSFLSNQYGGLCLLPVLADAAVIVDEVHSFDRGLLQALRELLQRFDVPVLAMTATLPPARKQELIDDGMVAFPADSDRAALADLEAKEAHPRYEIGWSTEEEAIEAARSAVAKGRRVLWVVNRVAVAQATAQRLEEALGVEVLCYHSRFKLDDRRARHSATVAAFQQREVAAVAVTTQVCEMSLDLDADVLVSEVAPVTSLVQRFGRANRHLARGDSFRATVLVVKPETHRPYEKEAIRAATRFVDELTAPTVSQRSLAEALERHAPAENEARAWSRFATQGYFATPGPLRDADEHGRRAVLDTDVPAVESALSAGRPIDGWLLTVPRRAAMAGPPSFPPYLSIAASSWYTQRLGFMAGESAHGDA